MHTAARGIHGRLGLCHGMTADLTLCSHPAYIVASLAMVPSWQNSSHLRRVKVCTLLDCAGPEPLRQLKDVLPLELLL